MFFSNIIALEERMANPLKCDCVNCRCFYDEYGTHAKCFPGWNGTLCDINVEAARRIFQKKIISKHMIKFNLNQIIKSFLSMFSDFISCSTLYICTNFGLRRRNIYLSKEQKQ
jgi:hypothetical protein